jgi:hypothetical protein
VQAHHGRIDIDCPPGGGPPSPCNCRWRSLRQPGCRMDRFLNLHSPRPHKLGDATRITSDLRRCTDEPLGQFPQRCGIFMNLSVPNLRVLVVEDEALSAGRLWKRSRRRVTPSWKRATPWRRSRR